MESVAFVRLRAPYMHRYSGFHPRIKSYSFLGRQYCNTALTLASTVPARARELTCNAGSKMEPIYDDANAEFSFEDWLSNPWDVGIMLDDLDKFCSDNAVMYYQILVEVRWLLKLSEIPEVKEVPTFSQETRAFLENIIQDFNVDEALEVKKKQQTNYDLKAVVYYLKQKCDGHSEVLEVLDFSHSMCTSEDINNLAYGLLIKDTINHVMFPVMANLCKALCAMARNNAHIAMLSHSHGQASSTTLGIEMATFAFRLGYWARRISQVPIFGNFAGVVGKYNAYKFAYRDIDWPHVAQEFVTSFGLQFNPCTTQIESHYHMVELSDILVNFNNVLVEFTDEVRRYISLGYFEQMMKEENESCTMLYKLDPFDFANSSCDLVTAKSCLSTIKKLIFTAHMKVNLTDIQVTRFGLAPSLMAYKKFLLVIEKIEVNESRLAEDLEKNWVVLAEVIQTVMEIYNLPEQHEKLKELTRGINVDKESISSFIENLDLPKEEKLYLLNLTPLSYIGEAENLAKLIDEALGSLLGFKIN
ncbi:Adenylosuccinate lyase [Rhynchospora pubera]|uniref:Adenylosuccinate lyase n=1 Tax=Rhynchospora pubera TaxID=906938 RepID=A0AAV8DLY7_9POAL|nr:Adenylosuccinate lyase [Rhynchospora pubera]